MNLKKLAPWNWFKKEKEIKDDVVPVLNDVSKSTLPVSIHNMYSEFDRLFVR